MPHSITSAVCHHCATPLTELDATGVCPRCLLAMSLRTRTLLTQEQTVPAPLPVPSPAEMGEKFPQYEFQEYLGRGGMGIVYKARQKTLDRLVAIKILAGEWQQDPGFADRFITEARLLARLTHPNIVTVHDFGQTDGLYYLVMEYVDGVNLRELLRDGQIEPRQALTIVAPVCEALQYAHSHGVVHRDIKPENLLLNRDGQVKIADFGIAVMAGGEIPDIGGTPAYMAPEQAAHQPDADHRVDLYALGVILYEMLTGERPEREMTGPPPRTQLDAGIDAIVMRALERLPERRFQSAGEMATLVKTAATTAAVLSSATPSIVASHRHKGRRISRLILLGATGSLLGIVSLCSFQDSAHRHPLTEWEKAPAAPAQPTEAEKPVPVPIPNLAVKLKTIRIPEIHFADIPVATAAKDLDARARETDAAEPDAAKKGIHLILSPGVPADLRIPELNLQNATLEEILRQICQLAGLSYSFDDFSVILTRPVLPDATGPVIQKLKSITLPVVFYKDISLPEAIDFLRMRSRELDIAEMDGARKGINFLILSAPSRGNVSPDSMPVIHSLQMRNASLAAVLPTVCEATGMSFDVDADAVILSPAAKGSAAGTPAPRLPAPQTDGTREAADCMEKLKSIIIPAVEFHATPLDEALALLRAQAADADLKETNAAKKGVAITVRSAPFKGGQPSGNATAIQDMHLRNIPLLSLLKYIAAASGMDLRVQKKGVVFAPTAK